MTNLYNTDRHPDLGELEALRRDESDVEVRRHVDRCAECRRRLGELAGLAGRLESLVPRAPIEIPASTDRAVLEAIARRAVEIQSPRLPTRRLRYVPWIAAATAAAALIGIAIWALVKFHFAATLDSGSESNVETTVALTATGPFDVDGSGAVDILDAYLMSRRLRRGELMPGELDFDHSGKVDDRDVDAVGQRAVMIAKKGS
ncbi:MAG: dockerin type I domain-containing protein [Planctomycetota bacterium]|nr:dockerin type I domain-containing protein [Planctomycetota bacterium]